MNGKTSKQQKSAKDFIIKLNDEKSNGSSDENNNTAFQGNRDYRNHHLSLRKSVLHAANSGVIVTFD